MSNSITDILRNSLFGILGMADIHEFSFEGEDTFIETVVVEFSCYLEDFLNVKNGLKHTQGYDITDKAFIESITYTYNNISCTNTHQTPHNCTSEPECEVDVDIEELEECYTNLFTVYCKDYPEGYRNCDRYVSN